MFDLQLVPFAPFPVELSGHRPRDRQQFCSLLTLTNLISSGTILVRLDLDGPVGARALFIAPVWPGVQWELSRHSSLHHLNYVISQGWM